MTKRITVITFLILASGIMLFMTGLHDIDNAWNMKYLNCEFDLNLRDSSSVVTSITANDLYSLGIMLAGAGLLVTVMGVASIFLVWYDKK